MIQRRGSILITVMFVLVLLSLVSLGMTYRTGLDSRGARHEAISIKLKFLSQSAIELALADLTNNTNDFDHWAEPWRDHNGVASRLDIPELQPNRGDTEAEYVTTYQVVDEEGKLNLLFASGQALEALGLSIRQSDAIFDWMDEDATARAEGVEDEVYQRYPTPYRSKNRPVETIGELLLVRGITSQVYWGEDLDHDRVLDPEENDGLIDQRLGVGNGPDDANGLLDLGLIDVLTLRGDGKININTAPREVLETLPISDEAVDQIVGFRAFDRNSRGSIDNHVFRSAEDVQTLNGLTDTDRDILASLSRFTSDYYRIYVQSYHQPTGLRHQLEVLVDMSEQVNEVPGILFWDHP